MFSNIILHIPHAGSEFPVDIAPSIKNKWRENAKDLIDWYTDELFIPEYPDATIHPVVFPFCRSYCDVERLSHDPLEEKGCGITYSELLSVHRGFHIKADKSIHQLYLDHQYHLASALIRYDSPLLIDCHSFSSHATILQPDSSKVQNVDICIGLNEDFTRPSDRVTDLVVEYFQSCGYRVAINTPFSFSKTVDTPANYKSLMIEVNKSLYMDENSLQKKPMEFARLKGQLQRLYWKLLED